MNTAIKSKLLNNGSRSDLIGAWASFLCLLHCIATPILLSSLYGMSFISESIATSHGEHGLFTLLLHVLFLIIASFAAIKIFRFAGKLEKAALIVGLVLFAIGAFLHSDIHELSYSIHVGSLLLVAVHLYRYFSQRKLALRLT